MSNSVLNILVELNFYFRFCIIYFDKKERRQMWMFYVKNNYYLFLSVKYCELQNKGWPSQRIIGVLWVEMMPTKMLFFYTICDVRVYKKYKVS